MGESSRPFNVTKQHIHPAPLHLSDQKVAVEIPVRQHHNAGDKIALQPAKQTVFVVVPILEIERACGQL